MPDDVPPGPAFVHRWRPAAAVAGRGLVGAAALVFVARHLAWREVWAILRQARLDLLAIVVALNGLMLTIRTERLRVLLAPSRPPRASLFTAVVASSAINNVAPLRAGDVARVFMLEGRAGIAKSTATAIAFAEKLLEAVVLTALGLLAGLLAPGQRWAAVAGGLGLGGALLALVLLRRLTGEEDGAELPAPGGRWRALVRRVAARSGPGLAVLRSRPATAQVLGASLVAWVCEVVMIVICARAVGLAISPLLAVVVLFGINLAVAVPALPANAGTFESAAAIVLILAGIAKPEAVAFALLYHLVHVIPVTLVGLALLARSGLRSPRSSVREA